MSAVLRSSSRIARLGQTQRRCFASSVVARKDIVQDLYLSELRSYKPPPAAKDAHIGIVKPFTPITPPKAPSPPTDLASELAAYDVQEPTLISASISKSATPSEIADDTGAGAKEFLAFLEADLPKHEAHH